MKRHKERVQLFFHFVGKSDQSGKRIGPRFAWKLAGIANGQLAAMPDDVIAWWWKLHDLNPRNAAGGNAQTTAQPEDKAGKSATGAS